VVGGGEIAGGVGEGAEDIANETGEEGAVKRGEGAEEEGGGEVWVGGDSTASGIVSIRSFFLV
jgi:hypothetical protein